MKKILIIEDERSIADTVTHSVQREGYAAVWRERGLEGLDALKAEDYALVVLDVGLPDIGGFELCKDIRTFSTVPIIFLTARDDEIDKIVGLEIGGDDYMTKPFSPRELAARIKTVLRRASSGMAIAAPAVKSGMLPGGGGISLRRLQVDEDKMLAIYSGKKLELTRYEFGLLALLASRPGRVFSRERIMQMVWGDNTPSLERTVDAHIKSLRAKCRAADGSVDPIVTHRGTGYALREEL